MNLQEIYYEVKFENEFLRARGDTFQTFFERLMGFAFREDYLPCRPWGRIGDRKNDGFLKSQRRLFQVYAPNEMEERVAREKITEDFEGAKIHWKTFFDHWSFVHNAWDGLPPHIHELLLTFEHQNRGIKLDPWGLEELRIIFRKILLEDKEVWFGLAPTDEAKTKIGFAEIQVVLQSFDGKGREIDVDVKPVPQGKIEANDFSENVEMLIKTGMTKAPLVEDFLKKWYDQGFGERLANTFRERYAQLRGTMHPNLIFSAFQEWIGGGELGSPEHQVAVLAVLAYYFEKCDIFEEPIHPSI